MLSVWTGPRICHLVKIEEILGNMVKDFKLITIL